MKKKLPTSSILNSEFRIPNSPSRLTLLARTREGYRNLCRLTSLVNLEPQRFGLVEDVVGNSEGLIVLCDQPALLADLAGRLSPGQLYAELIPGLGPAVRMRLRKLYTAARELGVPVAAGLDSYFARNQDDSDTGHHASGKANASELESLAATRSTEGAQGSASQGDHYLLHRIVTDIRLGTANRPPRDDDYQSPDRFHRAPDEMRQFFARCPEALANADRIAEQCEDEVVQLGTFHFPVSRVPHDETSFSFLHKLCTRGVRQRYRLVRPDVVSRLAYELSVIDKLHFADYFLFVNEIVSFARRRGIAVDVRGSAAGSLVAYALGFTQVCPIEHDLYFERFLHEGRTDCPDIDIDLCWRRRDEVIDFCYRRWGRDHVAMIATHNTMRARGAFVEVGKVLGLTPTQVFALSRHIPEGIAGYLRRDWRELAEARRNLPLDDPHFRRVLELAGQLEGAPRNLGIHCGGLVISPRPLADYLPVQWATKGIVITQYEMNAVEAIGLVKMDLLGNRALSEVVEAEKASGIGHQASEKANTPEPERLAAGPQARASREEAISNCKFPISNFKLEEQATGDRHQASGKAVAPESERLAAGPQARASREAGISNIKYQVSNFKVEEAEQGRVARIANLKFAICNLKSLDSLDPHDPATAALVSRGDTLGVFQAESPGMRNLCRQLRVASQEDLTVALSVIRPGPAGSGMKATYVARHIGLEEPTYLHPKLATLLARTHGVMVYQEDTMRVAIGIAGFSPAEADMLRKAVSKKRSPERMAALREQFIAKARRFTPDLSAGAAAELWEQVAHFASYSFCRAHACVYGRIAWQTAWLKAHHPAAFYCAVFNNHMGMYPMRVHVADAIRHGVKVLGPHVNWSGQDSVVSPLSLQGEGERCGGPLPQGAIRLGLRFVRRLSEGAIARIVAGRKDRPYRSLDELRLAAKLAQPELINLIRCGTCDGLGGEGNHRGAMLAEATLEEPVGELLASADRRGDAGGRGDGDSNVPFVAASPCPRVAVSCSSRFPWTREFTELEKLQAEIDVLGLFLSRHPMELVHGDWVRTDQLADRVGQRVAVAGVLDATRTTATSGGELMRFVTLEDQAGIVECTFFPEAYRRFGHLFYHLGPFRVEGVVESDRGAITLTADSAEPLVESNPLKLPQELYPPSQIV